MESNTVVFKNVDMKDKNGWTMKVNLDNRSITYCKDCADFLDEVLHIVKTNDTHRVVTIHGKHNIFLLLLRDILGLKGEFGFHVHKHKARYRIPEGLSLNDLYKMYSFKEIMYYLKALAYTTLDNDYLKILQYDQDYTECTLCETDSWITFNENYARIQGTNLVVKNAVSGNESYLPINRCPLCGRKL